MDNDSAFTTSARYASRQALADSMEPPASIGLRRPWIAESRVLRSSRQGNCHSVAGHHSDRDVVVPESLMSNYESSFDPTYVICSIEGRHLVLRTGHHACALPAISPAAIALRTGDISTIAQAI